MNVRLADVLAPGPTAQDVAEFEDVGDTHYTYEVLAGGALAVLEFKHEQVHTAITYAASAWLTVDGKRRGDQR